MSGRLSVGGMGEVYVAARSGLGGFQKPLALKLLLPHLAAEQEFVQRFLDEAHLAARMNHPNVVQIFDVGFEAGRYFIAMELVEGVSLSTLLKRARREGRSLPPEVLRWIAQGLCEGLHHAHSSTSADGTGLGLVHRDVTPHNVLVSVHGDVKLTDFGIAKARVSASYTAAGHVRGKLPYVSPEQIRDEPIDRRADLFGAAVTLYELATLHSPFERGSDAATISAVLNATPPPALSVRPDLDPSFSAALEQALQKDPTKRQTSAEALLQTLGAESPPSAKRALAALVQELCAEEVEAVIDRTQSVSHLLTATAEPRPGEPAGAPRFWPRIGAVLGSVCLAVMLAAGFGRLLRPLETSDRTESGEAAKIAGEEGSAPVSSTQTMPQLAASSATGETGDAEGAAGTRERPAKNARVRRSVAPVASVPASTSAKKQAADGFLTIDATPWARVTLNGKPAGETPLARVPAPSGRAEVVLENPVTGKSRRRVISVRPGELSFVREDLR